MCQRKFRPIKCTHHYSYRNFGTFILDPPLYALFSWCKICTKCAEFVEMCSMCKAHHGYAASTLMWDINYKTECKKLSCGLFHFRKYTELLKICDRVLGNLRISTFFCIREICIALTCWKCAMGGFFCKMLDLFCDRVIAYNQYPLLTHCSGEAAASYPPTILGICVDELFIILCCRWVQFFPASWFWKVGLI